MTLAVQKKRTAVVPGNVVNAVQNIVGAGWQTAENVVASNERITTLALQQSKQVSDIQIEMQKNFLIQQNALLKGLQHIPEEKRGDVLEQVTQEIEGMLGNKKQIDEYKGRIEAQEQELIEVRSAFSRYKRIDLTQREINNILTEIGRNELSASNLQLILTVVTVCFFVNTFAFESPACFVLFILCLAGTLSTGSGEFHNKKKWLQIYMKSLDRIQQDPRMSIRKAAQEVYKEHFDIDTRNRYRSQFVKLLNAIPNALIEGDPNEESASIQGELMKLVNLASAHASSFQIVREEESCSNIPFPTCWLP